MAGEQTLANLRDSYKWAKETAQALKTGNLAALDMDALLDEIESIASGVERQLRSALTDVLEALLWQRYTKADLNESDSQLMRAQVRLRQLLKSNPSLQNAVADTMTEAYQTARKYVSEDYGVMVPETCPFPPEQVFEDPIERLVAQGRLK